MKKEWPEERRALLNEFLNDLAVLEADVFRRRERLEELFGTGQITKMELIQNLEKEEILRRSTASAMRDFFGLRVEEVPQEPS